jgi:translation initiation factor 1
MEINNDFLPDNLVFQNQNDYVIHIRLQQRNAKKTITTIQGIPDDIDQSKILRKFKRIFGCNGHTVNHTKFGDIIQLQGDQRNNVLEFIVSNSIAPRENIIVHGF